MAPRLLSFLSLIEASLAIHECPAVRKSAHRSVNFHKGLCRLQFANGEGVILLQSFILADGQTCLKALLRWKDQPATSAHSVYPQGDFDWAEAAEKIAVAWMAGTPSQAIPAEVLAGASLEALAAFG